MAVSMEKRFSTYFGKHLDDADKNIVLQAMLGIGLLELGSEEQRLIPYFKDDDLRAEALYCYAACAPCEPTRARLQRLFTEAEDLSGGLSEEEDSTIKDALNTRADRYDLDPIFGPDGEALADQPVAVKAKVGRNDPCPCGSGKKYKKCCGG